MPSSPLRRAYATLLRGKPSWSRLPWTSAFAPIGVCAYIAGFAVPFTWDIPLLVLAFFSILTVLFSSRNNITARSALVFPVLVFVAATGLSTLVSEDVSRSVRLSVPLLPALLLFFLVTERFDGAQDMRRLYLTFSVVGLGLASVLLWSAWKSGKAEPSMWVSATGSPILVVPNDITFLAVVAPLSLTLLYQEPRGVVGVLAALSLLSSVCAVCLLQSRVALLTMIASVTCAAMLVRPRLGFACGLVTLILVLLVDGLLGFPLIVKFGRIWDSRISLWLAAWAMFLDAPMLGHGPHTFVVFYRLYLRRLDLPTWLPAETRVASWAHNLYLEVLAEQGIVGLIALGFLLVRGFSVARSLQRAPPGEAHLFGIGALAGLCGLCLAATVELSLLRQWVVITLFTFLGVISHLSSPHPTIQTKRREVDQ